MYLPAHKAPEGCRIWTLINVDFLKANPPISSDSGIWPIQASSPNPVRWDSWQKQKRAAIFGMPLWTAEELKEGIRLSPDYTRFLGELEQSIGRLNTCDDDIGAALDVLRRHNVGLAFQQQPLDLDNALDILVDNAIEEFGYAPRDVFCGVFYLPWTRDKHRDAILSLTYEELISLATRFSKSRDLHGTSHLVVVILPTPSPTHVDKWKIDFKTKQIGKEAAQMLCLETTAHLGKMFHLFHRTPESSPLAGWAFEAMVHRTFGFGWQEAYGPIPKPIKMGTNDKDPPTFSEGPPPVCDTSPLRTSSRIVKRVDLANELSEVTLHKDTYYTPIQANNPLFDSFIIDFDLNKGTATISIFQFTIAAKHEGSSKGYFSIRKIMKRVAELLGEEKPKPTVKYFLVCPDDESKNKWKMPTGWEEKGSQFDHRGDAFCIRIPFHVIPEDRR